MEMRLEQDFKIDPVNVEEIALWMMVRNGERWRTTLKLDWSWVQKFYESVDSPPPSPYQLIFDRRCIHWHMTANAFYGFENELQRQMDYIMGMVLQLLRYNVTDVLTGQVVPRVAYPMLLYTMDYNTARVRKALSIGMGQLSNFAFKSKEDGWYSYFSLDYTISVDPMLFITHADVTLANVESEVAVGLVNGKLMLHLHFVEVNPYYVKVNRKKVEAKDFERKPKDTYKSLKQLMKLL